MRKGGIERERERDEENGGWMWMKKSGGKNLRNDSWKLVWSNSMLVINWSVKFSYYTLYIIKYPSSRAGVTDKLVLGPFKSSFPCANFLLLIWKGYLANFYQFNLKLRLSYCVDLIWCWYRGYVFWPSIYLLLLIQKITDDDLIALMSDEVFQPQFVWQLENVQVNVNVDYIYIGFI